jgi:hypothetical protein
MARKKNFQTIFRDLGVVNGRGLLSIDESGSYR